MKTVTRYGRTSSGVRRKIKLSEADSKKIRRGRWMAVVTDQGTGEQVELKGAACDLPRCLCDMIIVPIENRGTTQEGSL